MNFDSCSQRLWAASRWRLAAMFSLRASLAHRQGKQLSGWRVCRSASRRQLGAGRKRVNKVCRPAACISTMNLAATAPATTLGTAQKCSVDIFRQITQKLMPAALFFWMETFLSWQSSETPSLCRRGEAELPIGAESVFAEKLFLPTR